MKAAFVFLCLASLCFADETREIAAVLRNNEQVSLNEVEQLKTQVAAIQKQLNELQAKDERLRLFLKDHLQEIDQKIAALSQNQVPTAPGTHLCPSTDCCTDPCATPNTTPGTHLCPSTDCCQSP